MSDFVHMFSSFQFIFSKLKKSKFSSSKLLVFFYRMQELVTISVLMIHSHIQGTQMTGSIHMEHGLLS